MAFTGRHAPQLLDPISATAIEGISLQAAEYGRVVFSRIRMGCNQLLEFPVKPTGGKTESFRQECLIAGKVLGLDPVRKKYLPRLIFQAAVLLVGLASQGNWAGEHIECCLIQIFDAPIDNFEFPVFLLIPKSWAFVARGSVGGIWSLPSDTLQSPL